MAVIKVETPDGIKKVEIAGDAPTAEETEAIRQTFFVTRKSQSEFGDPLAGLSGQDVLDRIRARSPGQAAEPKYPELTHPGLEVANAGFQFFYGKASNDEERRARLVSIFGEEGVEQRGPNNFILNLDNVEEIIKEKYDLPENGTMQVNRKGMSRYDFARFGGEYRGPLLTTLAVGILTAGVGWLPAMFAMGLAGAAGEGIDQYLEYGEGFQRQELGWGKGDIYRDMAFEAGAMFIGEGIFRGIFHLGGRVLKGPGPKPSEARVEQLIEGGLSPDKAIRYATEEARVLINKQVKAGARPNVEEATGKAFLGRLQAVYEAIIPNRTAARANSDYVKKITSQYTKGQITKEEAELAFNQQATAISKLIREGMSDPDEAVRIANRHLHDVIEQEFKEINKVVAKNLQKGDGEISGVLAQDFATALSDAARLFRQDSALLYQNAEKALGNKAVFDGAPLLRGIEKLEEDIFRVLQGEKSLVGTKLVRFLKGKIGKNEKFTLTELNNLRSVLNAQRHNPELIGTQAQRDAATLVKNVDEMLANQENILGEAISKVMGTTGGVGVKGTKGLQSPASVEEMRNGFNILRRANKHYMDGKAVFSSQAADQIITSVDGKLWVDLANVNKFIVNAGEPQKLKMWLDAITPSNKFIGKLQNTKPEVFDALQALAVRGSVREFNTLIKAEGLSDVVIKIPPWVGDLIKKAPDDITAKRILQENVDLMKMRASDVRARMNPNVVRDRVRDMLGNTWMRESLRNSIDKTGLTNYGRFAAEFKKLDTQTAKTLFGDNYNRLNQVANDALVVSKIRGNKTDIAALDETLYLPAVRQEIEKVQGVIRQAKVEGDNAFLSALTTGKIDDMDTLVTGLLNKPGNFNTLISRINSTQGKEAADQATEGIRDMTMARIVNTSFPDGITPEGIATGSFGEIMEQTIKQMNKNKALENILGSKELVNKLTVVSENAIRVSNRAFKGKVGLAPAAFIISAGYRALTAPLNFATELFAIVGLGKLLRSKTVLNFFTNPRLRSRQMKEGIRFGVDMGEDIVSIGARQRREVITQQARKLPGYGIRETTQAVEENIPEEVEEGVNQGIGAIGAGRDVLREIEVNKVLGIR